MKHSHDRKGRDSRNPVRRFPGRLLPLILLASLMIAPGAARAMPGWPSLPDDGRIMELARSHARSASSRTPTPTMPGSAPDGSYTEIIVAPSSIVKLHNPDVADPVASSEAFVAFDFTMRIMGPSGPRMSQKGVRLARVVWVDPPGEFALEEVTTWQTLRTETEIQAFLVSWLNGWYSQFLGNERGSRWLPGFKSADDRVEVDYVLGYDQDSTEGEAVPLTVRFRSNSRLGRIVGVTFVHQEIRGTRLPMYRENSEALFDSGPDIHSVWSLYRPEGTYEAEFRFLRFQPEIFARYAKTGGVPLEVKLLAHLDMRTPHGETVERQVPVSVRVDAAYKISLIRSALDYRKQDIPTLFDGKPLTPGIWIDGMPGGILRVPSGIPSARVAVRHLSGVVAMVANESADLYWELMPDAAGLRSDRSYRVQETEWVIRARRLGAAGEKIAMDKLQQKMLELLLRSATATQVGIAIEVVQSLERPSGGSRVMLRLRSTVGVSLDADGGIAVRTYAGNPEIMQPDGSILAVPAGRQTAAGRDGRFQATRALDFSHPSTAVFSDALTGLRPKSAPIPTAPAPAAPTPTRPAPSGETTAPDELEAALQRYLEAYERYTRLVTGGGEGNVQEALAEYRLRYAEYQRARERSRGAGQ